MKDILDNNVMITMIAFTICLTLGVVSWHVHLSTIDNNQRLERVEAIRVEKQHELEMTKQKAVELMEATRQKSIELDKSRKRKIWERPMDDSGE